LEEREAAALLIADLDCGVITREGYAFRKSIVRSSRELNVCKRHNVTKAMR
jgi:hypothetical protein